MKDSDVKFAILRARYFVDVYTCTNLTEYMNFIGIAGVATTGSDQASKQLYK